MQAPGALQMNLQALALQRTCSPNLQRSQSARCDLGRWQLCKACAVVTSAQSALQIRLKTLRRRARLLFLPAYVADYNFGESFNAHGERRPQRFQAVVSGMDPTSIAAERHYSPHKV